MITVRGGCWRNQTDLTHSAGVLGNGLPVFSASSMTRHFILLAPIASQLIQRGSSFPALSPSKILSTFSERCCLVLSCQLESHVGALMRGEEKGVLRDRCTEAHITLLGGGGQRRFGLLAIWREGSINILLTQLNLENFTQASWIKTEDTHTHSRVTP